MYFILPFIVYSVACGGLASWLAGEKGYKKANWFFCGLFLNIVGIITIGLAPDRNIQYDITKIKSFVRYLKNSKKKELSEHNK